jgi:hypothetical protein
MNPQTTPYSGTTHVLFVGDSFQMVRIDAPSDVAPMIDFQFSGVPVMHTEGHPMRVLTGRHFGVTVLVNTAHP